MKSVDFKSLVIGGLLVLVILCVVGAVPWLGQERFQRFTIVTMNNRAFMLDTATGQAWVHEKPPNAVIDLTGTQEFFAPKTEIPVLPVESNTSIP